VSAHPSARRSVPTENLDRLEAFGWDGHFAGSFHGHAALGRVPGRVVVEDRGRYLVETAAGELSATVSGRFRFEAGTDPAAFPAVGDWVALDRRDDDAAIIHAVLPRRTAILRLNPGLRTEAQVLAANVDVGLVVTSANQEFNLRRLERYLAVVWDSGAAPVVVLSKADLARDVAGFRAAAEAVAPGVPVLAVSAVDGRGIADVHSWCAPRTTVVAIGSSGVGKSTLVNALAGRELQPVSEIRLDDDRGRHTTRRRHLLRLPDGALILDTPGMRQLAPWDRDGLAASFSDVEAVAAGCRFGDCRHEGEPGCAVAAAIVSGELDVARLEAHRKLAREAAHLKRRQDALARIEERRRWKVIHKSVRRQMKDRYGEA
jgi:ribosome biogenesis GTPase